MPKRKREKRDQFFIGVVTERVNRDLVKVVTLKPDEQITIWVEPNDINVRKGEIVQGRYQVDWDLVGQVDKVIRASTPLQLATEVALQVKDVRNAWPDALSNLKVDARISDAEQERRLDLRTLPFVTIDGKDAKDFDDAVYCEKRTDGWHLFVAIADVAHYVHPGSALDEEAKKRGCSVYVPKTVVPMLPEVLSNGVCSLKPNEDRLSLVCEMVIGQDGEVHKSTFSEALICSQARLTYTEVANYLNGNGLPGRPTAVCDSIDSFHKVFLQLKQNAEQRGALDFSTNESVFDIKDGKPVSVFLPERNDAHRMIELAMVTTNVQAAEFLERQEVPALYRIHRAPSQEDLEPLRELKPKGFGKNTTFEHPTQIQALIDEIRARGKASAIWEMVVLSCLPKAIYSSERVGHFGLALETYLHFTSPIRRYPDLVVHRQIKAILSNKRELLVGLDQLSELGKITSNAERKAIAVERQVESWLKAWLIQSKPKRVHSGTVSSVKPFGLFIELDECFTSGLAHVSNLGSDYFEFSGDRLVGYKTGRKYQRGNRVKTKVLGVEPALGRIDLALAHA